MGTDLDQGYYGWKCEELSDQQGSQKESTISGIIDHGSISFGRFAVESLSWEKRSVFTHNRCQEELEKFKGGLVAQKKAYFEEYYKRIRDLKALQENQQTELTLDYGGDGSVSSQTGEEDETALHLESFKYGVTSIISACSEEPTVEALLEQEGVSSDGNHGIQIRNLDPEVAPVPCPDSQRRSLDEVFQERNSNDTLQIIHLDQESAAPASTRSSLEEVDLKKSSIDALQMPYLDESTIVDSLRKTSEEVKPPKNDLDSADEKKILGKYDNSMPFLETGQTVQWNTIDSSRLKPSGSEVKLSHDLITEKVKTPGKKAKEQPLMSKLKKKSDVSIERKTKSESRNRSDAVKPSQGLKYQLQKTCGDRDKETASRDINKNKSTSVSSHKPPKDGRPSITVPLPFSFATERRAAASTSIREAVVNNFIPKISSRSISSLVSTKRDLSLQHVSKRTVVAKSVKSVNFDQEDIGSTSLNTSHCKAVRKPFARDGHLISSKEREPVYCPNARSINLRASNKSHPNSGTKTGVKNDTKGEKRKEENTDSGSRKFQGSKPAADRSAPHRTEVKKITSSQTGDSPLNGKKTRFRQEVKRWR